MPIQLTKIMADGGVNYLLDTVANDQARTAMDYYTTPGNTPGVWMGDGCARLGVKSGQVASKNQVSNLFTRLTGPNGEKLTNQSQPDRKTDGTAVSGFDLTFTIPKSVSILWAVADDRTRRTIMRCHYEAINDDDALVAGRSRVHARGARRHQPDEGQGCHGRTLRPLGHS